MPLSSNDQNFLNDENVEHNTNQEFTNKPIQNTNKRT